MSRDRNHLLLDIVREARAVQSFVAGCEREQFAGDGMRQRAVNYALAIIGEALGNLDDSTRERLMAAAIPVRGVIRLRNRLVHEYWTLETDILWRTATEDMAPLLAAVGDLLPVRIEPAPPERAVDAGEPPTE